jgi:hypothetical protein
MVTASGAAIRWILLLAGMIGIQGCGNTPELPPAAHRSVGREEPRTTSVAPAVQSGEGRGYIHTIEKSKFRVGAQAQSSPSAGFERWVGAEGVFATVPETGWVLGIPNADAPSRAVSPLTESESLHNKTVLDYFTAAGLPVEQVDSVVAHASMRGGGAAASTANPSLPPNLMFDGYTSVITRVVAGIPVADSFAWARFNANGEVVEEAVFWPSIPDDVISGANNFVNMVADSTRGPLYLAKLKLGAREGRVTIRHSGGWQKSGFQSLVSYDVRGIGQMDRPHHFDINGTEFLLADEAPLLASTSRRH